MLTPHHTAKQIRQHIAATPMGAPFTSATFLSFGTRACVDQTLSRLTKAGVIARVARGVFVRPEISRFAGPVMPEPLLLAETLARTTGSVVQVHGAEAARRLELTTQMPSQSMFSTSGPSRRLRVGQTEIRLQHVSARKLALAGRPAGLALAAMWYLGKGEVTPSVIEQIRHKLADEEFAALKSAVGLMPAWMSDAFVRHGQAALPSLHPHHA